MHTLSFSRILYGFSNFSRILFEFTISFANSLWILYLYREFTINSLSIWQIHHGSIIFSAELTLNSLSLSRIHYGFINLSRIDPELLFFANLLWILNLFREFTMNSLIFSRILFEFTISFAN